MRHVGTVESMGESRWGIPTQSGRTAGEGCRAERGSSPGAGRANSTWSPFPKADAVGVFRSTWYRVQSLTNRGPRWNPMRRMNGCRVGLPAANDGHRDFVENGVINWW